MAEQNQANAILDRPARRRSVLHTVFPARLLRWLEQFGLPLLLVLLFVGFAANPVSGPTFLRAPPIPATCSETSQSPPLSHSPWWYLWYAPPAAAEFGDVAIEALPQHVQLRYQLHPREPQLAATHRFGEAESRSGLRLIKADVGVGDHACRNPLWRMMAWP
jgi:hypothetical protein